MKEKRAYSALRVTLLTVVALLVLAPILMVFTISFKSETEFLKTNFMPAAMPTFNNYLRVWKEANIPSVTVNSFVITLCSVLLQVLVGSLASYGLTRMRFKHEKLFSTLFLIPMVFSVQTIIFPLFLMYKSLHLLNTHLGLILIYAATGLATCIFIFSKYLRSIPSEICEAAQIDGAGHFRIYWQIVLPLTKAQISTIAVINGLGIWNDFFLPLMMFTNGKISTLPLSMYTFTTEYGLKWTLVSADIVFMMLPMLVVYFLLQKYIVEGVAAGAVKG